MHARVNAIFQASSSLGPMMSACFFQSCISQLLNRIEYLTTHALNIFLKKSTPTIFFSARSVKSTITIQYHFSLTCLDLSFILCNLISNPCNLFFIFYICNYTRVSILAYQICNHKTNTCLSSSFPYKLMNLPLDFAVFYQIMLT